MNKEDYISNFIAAYVSCVKTSTGISPEITAADYIQLRRQALLEYCQTPDDVSKSDKPKAIIPCRSADTGNDLHRNTAVEQRVESKPQTDKPDEDAELSILRSLGEED